MKEALIGLDIGGSGMKSAPVTKDGNFILQPQEAPSNSDQEAGVILNSITTFLQRISFLTQQNGYEIVACGVGMPGPTNYETATFMMHRAFESLYDQSIKPSVRSAIDTPSFFLNDADAFGLGVDWKEYPDESRLMTVVVSTGLGASFLVNGQLATEKDSAPKDREIYNYPYKESILENYVARNYLEREYKLRSKSTENVGVAEIANRARQNDQAAISTFLQMGVHLGEGLAMVSTGFKPDRIVFGGKISHAFDLFGEIAQSVYGRLISRRIPFSETTNEYFGILGAARYANQQLS